MVFIVFAVVFGVISSLAYGVPLPPSNPSPFIIGGETAPTAYAPFTVALLFGNHVVSILCGGAIISKSLILTAAHCMEPLILADGGLIGTFHIRAGSNQWNSGGITVWPEHYYMHPKWDNVKIKYDVAVVVLAEELVPSDTIDVIPVALDVVNESERVRTSVVGWGRTGPRFEDNQLHLQPTPDDKQVLYMNTIDHEQCQEQMLAVGGARTPPIERHIEICTFHSRGHGMCVGDSGSALVRLSTRELIGIVSWGYHCAYGAPDVFARTSGSKDFLIPIMETYGLIH